MVNNDLTYGNFCILLHRYFSLPEKWKAAKKEYFSQPRINFFYCCATFPVSDSVCNMFVVNSLYVFFSCLGCFVYSNFCKHEKPFRLPNI